MRLPVDNNGNIDLKLFSNMIDLYITSGFAYFDTAYGYMKKRSEESLRICLTERYPRDKYIIADKITLSKLNEFSCMGDYFNKQLENLGVDYIDNYMVHGLDEGKYHEAINNNCFDFIKALKEKGKVKRIGISFHDKSDILDRILYEQPELDFVQLQVNYLDWNDAIVQSNKCVDIAVKYGKRIIVMEPLKGGILSSFDNLKCQDVSGLDNTMSDASWGIRFSASVNNVDYVLSGMNSIQQLEDNVSYMRRFKPLNEREIEICLKIAKEYEKAKNISCTGCRYCIDECPKQVDIPTYLHMLNEYGRTKNKSVFYNLQTYYNAYSKNGSLINCVKCGKCELICPQKIKICHWLDEARNTFEGK